MSTGLKIIDLVQSPNMDKELFLRVLKEREVVSVFCHRPLAMIAFEGYSSLVHGQWFIGNIITQDSLGGFPGGAVVGNPPANAGDTGSSPGPGRSHMPWNN